MATEPKPDVHRWGEDLWAEGEPAQRTAQAIAALLDESPKHSRTIQWMPEATGGCRFEVIDVRSGELLRVARVAADGTVVLADA